MYLINNIQVKVKSLVTPPPPPTYSQNPCSQVSTVPNLLNSRPRIRVGPAATYIVYIYSMFLTSRICVNYLTKTAWNQHLQYRSCEHPSSILYLFIFMSLVSFDSVYASEPDFGQLVTLSAHETTSTVYSVHILIFFGRPRVWVFLRTTFTIQIV